MNIEDYEDSSMTILAIKIVEDGIYCKYSLVNTHQFKDGKINLIGKNFIATPLGSFKKLSTQEFNKEF